MAQRRHLRTSAAQPVRRTREAPPLGGRPAWSGNLRLSLVSCPVALYPATSRKSEISFHLINPETRNRIRMVPTDPDTGPVNRSDLIKGYEFEKNRYVAITNEELRAVRLDTTDNLEIDRFVDAATIDRMFWNEPYYLLPDGDGAEEAYGVIRDALRESNRLALGRVVMHTRERLMAVEPLLQGLVAYTLRVRDEVIAPQVAFDTIPDEEADPKMIEIAERIIEQNEGPFDPSEFHDHYEEALRDLVQRKQEGRGATIEAAPPEPSNVINLMDALRKSLKTGTTSKTAEPRKRTEHRTRKRAGRR